MVKTVATNANFIKLTRLLVSFSLQFLLKKSSFKLPLTNLIIHREKLFDSDWLRDCEFISNLRANN